jgi:hypothetical protein
MADNQIPTFRLVDTAFGAGMPYAREIRSGSLVIRIPHALPGGALPPARNPPAA